MSTRGEWPTRVDDISAMLAARPPRRVAAALRRAAMRRAAPLALAVFGIIFGGFGLVFTMVFFPWGFTREWSLHGSDVATMRGSIVARENTRMTMNDVPVVRYEFAFRPPGTVESVHGTAYTTGIRWQLGDSVTVRYRASDPSVACPTGARMTQTTLFMGSMTLLFPAVGLAVILFVIARRRAMDRLLRLGKVAEALVTSVESTSTEINDQRVYRIRLEFIDRLRAKPVMIRRHQPEIVRFVTERMETKQPVFVLFDPQKPSRVLVPETL